MMTTMRKLTTLALALALPLLLGCGGSSDFASALDATTTTSSSTSSTTAPTVQAIDMYAEGASDGVCSGTWGTATAWVALDGASDGLGGQVDRAEVLRHAADTYCPSERDMVELFLATPDLSISAMCDTMALEVAEGTVDPAEVADHQDHFGC